MIRCIGNRTTISRTKRKSLPHKTKDQLQSHNLNNSTQDHKLLQWPTSPPLAPSLAATTPAAPAAMAKVASAAENIQHPTLLKTATEQEQCNSKFLSSNLSNNPPSSAIWCLEMPTIKFRDCIKMILTQRDKDSSLLPGKNLISLRSSPFRKIRTLVRTILQSILVHWKNSTRVHQISFITRIQSTKWVVSAT